MDVQRKKGILEVCVLAVLKKGPSYGYLIIRELEQCVDISESTLYPILKRLEQNGSLETYRLEYNGRMRKYYRLTQTGQQKIDLFLEEWEELRTMYQFIAEQNERTPEPAAAGSEEETEEPFERAATGSDEAAEEPFEQGAAGPEKAAEEAAEGPSEQGTACPGEAEELPAGWGGEVHGEAGTEAADADGTGAEYQAAMAGEASAKEGSEA